MPMWSKHLAHMPFEHVRCHIGAVMLSRASLGPQKEAAVAEVAEQMQEMVQVRDAEIEELLDEHSRLDAALQVRAWPWVDRLRGPIPAQFNVFVIVRKYICSEYMISPDTRCVSYLHPVIFLCFVHFFKANQPQVGPFEPRAISHLLIPLCASVS
jgi:hypothetical protein